MKTRADIIDYASRRGIGVRGNSAIEIAEILGNIDSFGQGCFKKTAMKVIIDAQERNKRKPNPRMTGSLNGKKYSNPKEYLSVIESELNKRVQQEEVFLRDFVNSNNNISEEAKAFLRLHVSAMVGPWNVENHVTAVTENNGQIIVQHQNGEFYYYLEQDIDEFLEQFVTTSDYLSTEAKDFVRNLVKTEQGPWNIRNHVSEITENNGRIAMKNRNGTSYHTIT